jgi:hypothetical protein
MMRTGIGGGSDGSPLRISPQVSSSSNSSA